MPLTPEERHRRSALEASFPKCPCGNTARRDSDPPRCSRCSDEDDERKSLLEEIAVIEDAEQPLEERLGVIARLLREHLT